MTVFDRPGFRAAFSIVALFTVFAGDAWRYSVGWVGFGVVAVALVAVAVAILFRERAQHNWRFGSLPYPLVAFAVLATVSLAWSHYPGATALGLLTTGMTLILAAALAAILDWPELLRTLGVALRVILGASLLFELVVSLFFRRPVFPIVAAPGVDYDALEKVPKLLYWSRNELFEVFDGGKIQGIVGNSSLLGFVALVALIVFALQLAGRSVGKPWGLLWLATAAATTFFTRSATITLAIAALALLTCALLLIRRARSQRRRTVVYLSLSGVIVIGATLAVVLRSQILGALGKSDDLTGRLDIWDAVIGLASERPVFGWGWVSFWAPWVDPFDSLIVKSGVRQLHAHNAWLDIWLQLGIIGLIVFVALVFSTAVRAWLIAIDRPVDSRGTPGEFTYATLLPILLLAALIIQSVAESRLLIEYGLVCLAVIAINTKRHVIHRSTSPEVTGV
ncbi:MAG: O-antigen ligase family protein [Microbacteriaceae bacterium]